MALTIAKFIVKDANSLEASGDSLAVNVDDSTVERAAGGIRVKALGIDTAQLAIDAADATILDLADTYDFVGTLQYGGINVATETFVNNAVQGLVTKDSCRVATTANTALTGEQTIDGILTTADRILVKDQTAPAENGIYVTAAGAWARAVDTDAWVELPSAYTWIEEGTTQADTGWSCTVNEGGTIGVTAVTWAQFTGAALITAGTGLTKTGNTINAIAGDDSITMNANDFVVNTDASTIETAGGVGIRVKAAGINENHIAATAQGGGLAGGSGSVLTVDRVDLLVGCAHILDGDDLEISWVPTNYTRDATPAEAAGVTSLTAHLKGIDTSLAAINDRRVETFTLAAGDITNKYVTLAATPAAAGRVTLIVKSAPGQHYGDDFQMDGVNPDRLTWSALALDGVLAVGDKLTPTYDV